MGTLGHRGQGILAGGWPSLKVYGVEAGGNFERPGPHCPFKEWSFHDDADCPEPPSIFGDFLPMTMEMEAEATRAGISAVVVGRVDSTGEEVMKNWIVQQIITFAKGSWKTTAVGFLAAFTVLVLPILQSRQIPTEQQWFLAFFVALAGLVCKDADKVGTGNPGDPVRGGTPSEQREAVSKDIQRLEAGLRIGWTVRF